MLAANRPSAGVKQQKRASAIRALRIASRETLVTDKRALLVANEAGGDNGVDPGGGAGG